MEFYRRLYVGESVKKVNTVKRKLRTGAGQFSVYLICLANNRDQLEIFHSGLLKQKAFPRKDLCVVGIAGSKEEAYRLVGKILAETLQAGMAGEMKQYLLQSGEDVG